MSVIVLPALFNIFTWPYKSIIKIHDLACLNLNNSCYIRHQIRHLSSSLFSPQVMFHSEAHKNYTELLDHLVSNRGKLCDSESRAARIQQNLSQIKALSITVDELWYWMEISRKYLFVIWIDVLFYLEYSLTHARHMFGNQFIFITTNKWVT